MERTCSLESPRRLRFACDRRRERGQLKSGLASSCACLRRSCPCIHELDGECAPPAGDLDLARGRSADWLTVAAADQASRSDSALHSARPRPRFELDAAGPDITESEPLLAVPPGNGETRI